MSINSVEWQKEPNSIWYTHKKLRCDICKKRVNRIWEALVPDSHPPQTFKFCFNFQTTCFPDGLMKIFAAYPNIQYIWIRGLIHVPQVLQRESVGLSLRYRIMKRDGFKCVLCGNTAEDSKLEVDHIVPVSCGGSTKKENLRTLCFDCNRGKRDIQDEMCTEDISSYGAS